MKNVSEHKINKPTTILTFWIIIAMSLTACQTETTDLEQIIHPKMESEIVNIDEKDELPESPTLESSTPPTLPNIGSITSVSGISRPGETINLQHANMIDVEQVISIERNEIKPMLDLLFVIDDSASMEPHQNNLAAAMKNFTGELSKLNLLDYRIAVTSIYDSERYFKKGSPGEDRYEQGITEWSRKEFDILNPSVPLRNFFRLGRLLPIKNHEDGSYLNGNRFATPQTHIKNLESTLKVGAQLFQKYDEYNYISTDGKIIGRNQNRVTGLFANKDLGTHREELSKESKGPRFEELISPMLAALSPQTLLFGDHAEHYRQQFPSTSKYDSDKWTAPKSDDKAADEAWLNFSINYNDKFVREKAHLGVIFVTDTIDQSVGVTPREAAEALKNLKGDDGSYSKISTYGVLHKNTVSYDLQRKHSRQWSRRHCTTNNRVDDDVRGINGFDKPQMLEEFLRLTGGKRSEGSNILNICSNNYGENLVQVAKDLFKDSLQRGEYDLEMVPAQNIEVVFKNQPERKVPTCQSEQATSRQKNIKQTSGLCWQVLIKPGIRKLILMSQDELEKQELLVRYKAIDPRTANSLNSQKVGN